MEFLTKLFLLFFCQTLVFAEEGIGDRSHSSTNHIFDLPDIVENYKTPEGEVQLEAFGDRMVNYLIFLSFLESESM